MVVRTLLLLALCLGLAACGAPAAPLTASGVVEAFTAAGIEVSNVQPGVREADSPVPNSFREFSTFTIASVAPSGGQVFVCDTKPNCDAIYAYFDALKALAGPYLYQSPNGLVVAQLNSGLTPDEAKKFETVIAGLK